jgi:hypothetical protein
VKQPLAWGMPSSDGNIYDVISPEEHDNQEGSYTIPLYAADTPLTEDEVWEVVSEFLDIGGELHEPYEMYLALKAKEAK